MVGTVRFGAAAPFFSSLSWFLSRRRTGQRNWRCSCLSERHRWNMTYTAKSRTLKLHAPKLTKSPQPPLSYPGAAPESYRAKRPPLTDPAATDQELNPGDRVAG